MVFEQYEAQSHGILVVEAAAAVQLAAFSEGLELSRFCRHDIEVAHEQYRGSTVAEKDEQGRAVVVLEAASVDAKVVQVRLDKVNAALDLLWLVLHGPEPDQRLGETTYLLQSS
jgi:hypothetical protein